MSGPTVTGRQGGDAAYRALLGHTMVCAACTAGEPCLLVVALRRAWRKARR